jgi:hypothetical protein
MGKKQHRKQKTTTTALHGGEEPHDGDADQRCLPFVASTLQQIHSYKGQEESVNGGTKIFPNIPTTSIFLMGVTCCRVSGYGGCHGRENFFPRTRIRVPLLAASDAQKQEGQTRN